MHYLVISLYSHNFLVMSFFIQYIYRLTYVVPILDDSLNYRFIHVHIQTTATLDFMQ